MCRERLPEKNPAPRSRSLSENLQGAAQRLTSQSAPLPPTIPSSPSMLPPPGASAIEQAASTAPVPADSPRIKLKVQLDSLDVVETVHSASEHPDVSPRTTPSPPSRSALVPPAILPDPVPELVPASIPISVEQPAPVSDPSEELTAAEQPAPTEEPTPAEGLAPAPAPATASASPPMEWETSQTLTS